MRKTHLISAFQLFSISAFSQTFPAANGLERSLVAEQPLLRNPVSVSMDVDGTIYVTETARRKAADLDIRDFYNYGWVPKDVSHTSVEDKLAFFREQLDGKNKFPKTALKDHNKDGRIDVEDLTAITEKIIRVTDRDGDGKYDTSNTFAEDFNTEVTGIAAGTLAWRGDVYATIAPDVWKLRDTTGDGKADKRESIAHGFGVHIAYAGHDMHGLTLGPDGRIYWSIGDKGVNVTSREGKNFFAPHEGAVLRCYPDGSGFEIFARGLRNPQEIAFDQYGNLFSVDNDSDRKGERERFLHITEGSDTGWRNYYQYRTPAYNPWMAEQIWEPSGEFQPAYITPTNLNYSDGPAGFAFNPGTALNEKYRNAFFVSEFPKGALRSFKVKPRGATFEMTDDHAVVEGPMNVGINFGPDGALYSADWGGGYPLNDKGAIWKLDDPSVAGTAIRKEVAEMLKTGPAKVPTMDLVERLSHPDQRIRLDAQWELVDREASARPGAQADPAKSEAKTALLAAASAADADEMTVIHALWGLTQMKAFDLGLFEKLSKSDNPEFRAQALRYGADSLRYVPELAQLLFKPVPPMLKDDSPRVRYFAAMAVWKLEIKSAIDDVITMLAENNDQDAYLRHAGVMALTASSAEEIAEATTGHASPAVRLAAAVAYRRLSSPLATRLLADRDPKVVSEAARAIFDDPAITEAYPALADLIRTDPRAQPPAIRRSITANRYLADAKSASRLATFAGDSSHPEDLRIAALEALASWTETSELNPVDGRWDPLEPADAAFAKPAYLPVAAAIEHSAGSKDLLKAAARVAKNLGIVASADDLVKQTLDAKLDPAVRIRSLEALESAKPDVFAKTLPGLLKDSSAEVRSHAASLLAEKDPATVIGYAKQALLRSNDVSERQQAVVMLGKMKDPAAKKLLGALAIRAGKDPAAESAILLELTEALPSTATKLAPVASLEGGNPTLGENVFNENLAANCTACHRIGDEGSEVGPPLTQVGKKGREYILESLVAPGAKLAPGYGLMSLTTNKGITVAGSILKEDDKILTLVLPDKSEVDVNKTDIASRTEPMSTMPPMAAILSPREIRDLVAYLSSLK